MALGNLFVSIRASASEWASDIKAIQRDGKELEKSIKPLKDQAKEMGTAFAVAGAAIVGSFAAAIKATADFGDQMNDASKRTGIATETLSKLKLAADTSGSSFEGLTTGLKLLGKNMEAANSGSKEQVAAFKAAGISAKDLRDAHGDVNVILNKLADTFKGADDGAGKTAIAMKLLGKSGTDLIPMLNEGSAGLKMWGDEAERSGRIVSTEAAAAADAFNDQLTVMEGSLAGVGGAIGSVFIPPLTEAFKSITEVVNAFRNWAAEHPGLIKAIGALGLILTGAGGILLGLTAVLTILPKLQVAFTLLKTAFVVITGPVGLTVIAITALVAAIVYFRKEIASGLLKSLSLAVEGFSKFIGFAAKLADAVGLKGVSGKLKDLSGATGMVSNDLTRMGDSLLETTGLTLKATKAVTDATDGAKKHTLALAADTKEMDAQHRKIQDILKNNSAALIKDVADAEAQVSRSLKVVTDEWVKAGETISGIIRKNDADMTAYLRNVETQTRSSLDIASDAFGKAMDKQIKDADDAMADLKKIEDDAIAARKKSHEDAVNSVRESAGKIFDDMFIKGENVFTSLGNLLKGGALSLGRSIFEDVTAALLGPIKEAFDSFFKGLIDGPIKALGKAVSGIFTDGASAGVSAAGGGTSGVPGGGGGGGGGAAGAAASGGAVGIANLIVDAVGFTVLALLLKRIEGTMNAVEANTRFTYIEIKDTMEQILQPVKNWIEFLTDRASTMVNQLDAIFSQLVDLPTAIAAAMPMTAAAGDTSAAILSPLGGKSTGGGLGSYATGTDFVPTTGLYQLHRGEAVVPSGGSGGVTVNLTIQGNMIGNAEFTRQMTRDIVRAVERESVRLPSSEVKR